MATPPADVHVLDDLLVEPDVSVADVAAAAAVEAEVGEDHAFGEPGPPLDRRSPFWVGMTGTLGVGVALFLAVAVYFSRGILLLVLVSLFVAAGLDPVVSFLHRWIPRGLAVVITWLLVFALLGGFLGLLIPVIVNQVTALVEHLPTYFRQLQSHNSTLGRLNSKYHVETTISNALKNGGSSIATGVLGVAGAVLGAVTSTAIVLVLSIYMLADLPRVKRLLYGLAPRSRRARTVVLGDEIFAKVGGYLLGNILISVITGIGTYVWSEIFGIPYALLLAFLVALFDLVPVVGSTVGGVVVALVALTVSLPIAIVTVAFYIAYRLIEDYLLSPRIMMRTVDVPGLVTVVATLLGGAMLGIIGALIAIPVAASIKVLIEQVVAPRIERS